MLVPTRQDLAANLVAYGEADASGKIQGLSEMGFERVCKIGFKHALAGVHLDMASCLAAIEVIEGQPRPLRRKRRVWKDVPAELCQIDPKRLAIHRWFEEYGAGQPIEGRKIIQEMAGALAPVLDGFRYFKSFAHFRGVFNAGASYIGLERGHGVVDLRFGVFHSEIERIKGKLFPQVERPDPRYARTISKFTPNMGPTSPHWKYPVRPQWPVSGTDGLARACREVADFVRGVALPYVIDHREPQQIRDTLLNHPGKADQQDVPETVFSIDWMLRDHETLRSDYGILKERYATYVVAVREKLDQAYSEVRASWNAL